MAQIIGIGQERLIAFVMVDTDGSEVTGLGSTLTVEISKNGGVFAAGTGTKAEVGSGWYTYRLSEAETDTAGPLAIRVTGIGAVQQNLLYQVSGSIWEAAEGPNILTTEEAATVLRCENDDPNMLILMPQIDAYIENATGHDWAADSTIQGTAKSAARMLLVLWHENPGMIASGTASLNHGLLAVLAQLEALALRYMVFEGLSGAGAITLKGAEKGDTVEELVGVVGISGDQSASFESVITYDGEIQQTSGNDLSEKWFRVLLTPPAR